MIIAIHKLMFCHIAVQTERLPITRWRRLQPAVGMHMNREYNINDNKYANVYDPGLQFNISQ